MANNGPVGVAIQEFRRARRRAEMESVLALLSGQESRLLSYEEVKRRLRAVETAHQELAYIPVADIVGSVGRYQDFTRSFLPRSSSDEDRWVQVQRAVSGLEGVPPIEAYRIGSAYFVKDGNHRVSVAEQSGVSHIEALVTDVATRVPFHPGMDHDELIVATELAEFLDRADLDELRPGSDVRVTAPGGYPELLEHISVHRYFMGLDERRPVGWAEAVGHWYDTVYEPVAQAIRLHGLLDAFPRRTEADLYLFLSEHRGQVEEELGWALDGSLIAESLGRSQPDDIGERAGLLKDPDLAATLLDTVLLCLDGGGEDEHVLQHGLELALREGATVLGVRLARFGALSEAAAEEDAAAQSAFRAACAAAGVEGQLAFSAAATLKAAARELRTRAKYADLLVVARSSPLTRALLRYSPKPLLLASPRPPGASRPLLAYDGGARADAALFAVAYFCLRRGLGADVLHVGQRPGGPADPLRRAERYLADLGVQARLVTRPSPVAEGIAAAAAELGNDVLFLGSHSRPRWVEEVLGGVLDDVLELTDLPLLVT